MTEPVDFLIVTALREEREAVLRLLDPFQPTQGTTLPICYLCQVPIGERRYKVAVTQLARIGNVEAGVHVTQAISAVRPSVVLVVGIAAGVKGKVSLGDVIVATDIIYYEQSKETSQGSQLRPLTICADPDLVHIAQNYSNTAWREAVAAERPSDGSAFPDVLFGPLAVGDKIVADPDFVARLIGLHPKLIGIEMESYGAAVAALKDSARPRFLAVRGICDYADESKNDDWHEYAATAAAAFMVGLIQSEPVLGLVEKTACVATEPRRCETLVAIRHSSMEYVPFENLVETLLQTFASRDVKDLLIDQTDLCQGKILADPIQAIGRQMDVARRIDNLRQSFPGSTLAYFGIAHIPLLFHLGYQLTNKRPLEFFELNRYTGQWEHVTGDNEGPPLLLSNLPSIRNNEMGDIVLRVSISDPILPQDARVIVPDPLASVHLHPQTYRRDVLSSARQLRSYGAQFRYTLDQIHHLFPNRGCTHIFYAGPASLAVYFGQLLSPSIERRIVVYNYLGADQPRYSWGLEVTSSVTDLRFLHKCSLRNKEK